MVDGDIIQHTDFKAPDGEPWTVYYFIVGRVECYVCIPYLFNPVRGEGSLYYKTIQDVLTIHKFYVECHTKKLN